MERLTGNRTTLSNGDVYCDLETLGGENCGDCCKAREYCKDCPIQDAFNRLSSYEDTGLEPEEIAARDEGIKQIFCEYIERRSEDIESSEDDNFKATAAFASCDVTELYSQIFNISYDEAAKVLHGGDGND